MLRRTMQSACSSKNPLASTAHEQQDRSILPAGRKTVHLYVKSGYLQRHSDLLAILAVVAIMFVVASGIYYLGEMVHAPMQARIFAGPATI